MQITETLTENLHREFKIVVGAKDLDAKLTGRLTEMQPQIQLKGFRPGKAPVSFLKKTYGKSLMGEIINATIQESSEKALKDRELKPAAQPSMDFNTKLDDVVEGNADLDFTMKVDLMPDFEIGNLSDLKAERLVADVVESDVDEAVQRIADQQKSYADKGEGAVAANGDAVTLDFLGKLDGEPFEGGKAEGFDLTLGSGSFIPGFEEQIVGLMVGDAKTISVKFPDDYGAANLAGKDTTFDITIHAVKAPEAIKVDDEFATKLGLESLAQLKERVREQLKGDYTRISRTHLKRRLLDALDEAHDFELPPGMVAAEFDAIWKQVEAEIARDGKTGEDADKSDDELKAEYRDIAERRVRLGLLLAKIGEQNGLSVTQDEINRAIMARARQYPGQEQRIFQFIANNPQALNEIRVPLFEDKVVDFIAELAQISDRSVDKDILMMDPDEAAEKLDGKKDAKPKASGGKKKKG